MFKKQEVEMAAIPNKGVEADRKLIASYGGATRLARLLNIPGTHPVQRVQNWTQRGIPPAVKVQFPHIFMPELAQAPAAIAQPGIETTAQA